MIKTVEEKAKAYDKAKCIMKEYLESGNAGVIAENTIKKAFPELSESEDERIRKALIDYFRWNPDGQLLDEFSNRGVFAWLEKQAQKPDTNCLLNWSEMDEKMLQSLECIVKDYWAKAEQEKNEIKIREASNVSYFLKTIQKSPLCWIKCSDELPNKDGIYLVVTDGRHNDVYDMARYDSIKGWHKASEIIYWMPIPQLNNKSIIEQKPADNIEKPAWSEDDENRINRLIAYFEDKESFTAEDDVVYANWLNSLRPCSQWKPSDAQMKALSDINVTGGISYAGQGQELINLYNALKKLRGE